MKNLKTQTINIKLLDSQTVLIEALQGVEINASEAKAGNELIEQEMTGNYGMIIHRKADYSIAPVEVYDLLNRRQKLKAIAIIKPNKKSCLPLSIERQLFKGPFATFHTIKDAHEWLNSVVN